MKIYEAEKKLGLEERISKASANVVLPASPLKLTDTFNFTRASAGDEDLYYFKSILVSASWNLNDDVFDPVETWRARKTPKDKLLNVEHDHSKICGHMVDCYAVKKDGKLISDATKEDDLPNTFDLIAPSVLYRLLNAKDEKLRIEAATLIDEIEAGKWSVSMECLFDDFDYMIKKDGKAAVVKRNSATAHMSKYLRAYGGEGEYDGYQLGRIPKNIIFCGKGLVKNPGNPDSVIILDVCSANDLGYKNKVNSNNVNKAGKKMDEKELLDLKTKLASAESSVSAAQKKNDELETRLKELSEKEVKAKLETAASEVTAAIKRVTDLEAQVKTEQTARTDAEAKVTGLTEELNKVKKTLEESTAAKTLAERVGKWVARTGLSSEEASKKVAKFSALSDEQFNDVVDAQPKTATPPVVDVIVKEPEKVEDKTKALDKAEPDKAATTASSGTNGPTTATKLAQFFVSKSSKNKTKKGE